MHKIALIVGMLAACGASAATAQNSWEDREVERLSWPELQRFENDRAFRAYVRDVRRMQKRICDRRADAADVQGNVIAVGHRN